MFLCNKLLFNRTLWKRKLISSDFINNVLLHPRSYSGVTSSTSIRLTRLNKSCTLCQSRSKHFDWYYQLQLQRRWSSNELSNDKLNEFDIKHNKEIKRITDLFPEPRVTLNILISRTPSKIFDIYYKQNSVAPKGRKKGIQHNEWTCTYAFVWPEKIKFECAAISKRQAAEKAATQAIHWLYTQRRIDNKGQPIYDRNVLEEIKNTLDEPIKMSINDKYLERAEKIWNDYQNGIMEIYENTLNNSKYKVIQPPMALTKDSTIDEDDIPDNEIDLNSIEDMSEIKRRVHPVYGRNIMPPKPIAMDRRDQQLRQIFERYDEELTPLPIDQYRKQITSTLEKSQVAIIVGAAGCGKSTRVPAAILQHFGANTAAIVSEPRRVAALGLAERVASELGEEVGQSIGYQVRLHANPPRPPCGSVLYCTSGVLLRRLQTNPGLEGCSHVIIDEAHERDVNTDITLLLLKRAMSINPDLKVIVMSATLDIGVFTKYFPSCPVIEVPGRTFSVEVSYLDDIQKKFRLRLHKTLEYCQKEDGRPQVKCEEVAEVIKAVDKNEKEGAILVFLPGWSEIKQTKQLLDEHYGHSGIHMILPVHSRLSTTDQTKMFSIPSPGIRKIVLATNVAETSITIPDVVYVIDTGSHKETRIKERTGTASLETVWVSMAGAKQRAGRAGRVQPGHCYRMYTKEKEEEFAPHITPEILRIPLEQTVLDCKSYAPNEKIEEFLSELPEPPSTKAIQFAVKDLIEIGALTTQEQLTRLGSLLSSLTLHPRVGKSLLHSAIVGNIVAMSNVAAHCASNTEVFSNAADRRDEIREIKRKYSSSSDHAALYGIQEQFVTSRQDGGRVESDRFCEKFTLRGDRLAFINSLSKLHLEQVLKSGMIVNTTEADELNRFSDIEEILCGVFLSGADSLLICKRYVKTKGKIATVNRVFTSSGDRAHIASESVNYNITKRSSNNNLLAYFGGQHSIERRALVVYKSSLVPPQTALLFCPGDVLKHNATNEANTTILELPKHRLKIHVPTTQVDHLLKIREMLWKTLRYYIERDLGVLNYDDNTEVSRFKVRLIKLVGRILVEGHREHVENKSVDEELLS